MTDTLRPRAAIRYYGLRHRDGCCGSDDPEECSCGAADALAKATEIEGLTQQGEDDAGDVD